MKTKATIALLTVVAFITSCSMDTSKFVPDMLKKSAGLSTNNYTFKHGKRVFNIIRDGITFSDGSYITQHGEGRVVLPKGYYYVSSDSGRILAANKRGDIMIIKSNGEELASTKLESPLVSGVAYSQGVAYLLQGNLFGIYNPFNKKIIYQKQFSGGSSVDSRLANPIVTSNYLAIPTLDGKLVMINMNTPAEPGVIPVGKNKNYGNLIFTKSFNGSIVAATPSVVLNISSYGKKEYRTKVADLTISSGLIYLLTRDGNIVKLSSSLDSVANKKFAYADFATIAVLDGKVYAYAKSGSLVVLDDSLDKYKIYSIGAAKTYSFVSGSYLYIDDKKVNLSALSYE